MENFELFLEKLWTNRYRSRKIIATPKYVKNQKEWSAGQAARLISKLPKKELNPTEEEIEPQSKPEIIKPKIEPTKPEPTIGPLFYNPDNKCMCGIYKVIKRDDNITTIENIQEIEAFGYMLPNSRGGKNKLYYFDGTEVGYGIKRIVDLPTKKVHLIKEIGDDYCEFNIPYFVYKPLEKELKILKLDKKIFSVKDMTSRADVLNKYI